MNSQRVEGSKLLFLKGITKSNHTFFFINNKYKESYMMIY